MLKRKRHEVGDKAGKLKGGLQKLQETGVQVAEMQVSIHLPSSMIVCVPCQCDQLKSANKWSTTMD